MSILDQNYKKQTMIKYSVLDAFTGVSAFEKLGIVNFLISRTSQDPTNIKHAVDYAVKDRPSFGGFILSATLENDPVAVAIINRTGIKAGNAAKNMLVTFAVIEEMAKDEILIPFFEKLIEFCNGDLSVNLLSFVVILRPFGKMRFKYTRLF